MFIALHIHGICNGMQLLKRGAVLWCANGAELAVAAVTTRAHCNGPAQHTAQGNEAALLAR